MDNYVIRTETILKELKSNFPEINFYVCSYKRTKKNYIVTKSYLNFSIEITNKATRFIKDAKKTIIKDSDICYIVVQQHDDFYNQCDKLSYYNKGLSWLEGLKKEYPNYEFILKKFPYMYVIDIPFIDVSLVFREKGVFIEYHNDIRNIYINNCLYKISSYQQILSIIDEDIQLYLERDKQIVDNR